MLQLNHIKQFFTTNILFKYFIGICLLCVWVNNGALHASNYTAFGQTENQIVKVHPNNTGESSLGSIQSWNTHLIADSEMYQSVEEDDDETESQHKTHSYNKPIKANCLYNFNPTIIQTEIQKKTTNNIFSVCSNNPLFVLYQVFRI